MFQKVERSDAGGEPEVRPDGLVPEVIHLSPEDQLALAMDLIEDAPARPISDFALQAMEEYNRTVTSL